MKRSYAIFNNGKVSHIENIVLNAKDYDEFILFSLTELNVPDHMNLLKILNGSTRKPITTLKEVTGGDDLYFIIEDPEAKPGSLSLVSSAQKSKELFVPYRARSIEEFLTVCCILLDVDLCDIKHWKNKNGTSIKSLTDLIKGEDVYAFLHHNDDDSMSENHPPSNPANDVEFDLQSTFPTVKQSSIKSPISTNKDLFFNSSYSMRSRWHRSSKESGSLSASASNRSMSESIDSFENNKQDVASDFLSESDLMFDDSTLEVDSWPTNKDRKQIVRSELNEIQANESKFAHSVEKNPSITMNNIRNPTDQTFNLLSICGDSDNVGESYDIDMKRMDIDEEGLTDKDARPLSLPRAPPGSGLQSLPRAPPGSGLQSLPRAPPGSGLQASDVGNLQTSPRAPTAGDLHSLPRAPLGSGLQSLPRAPPSSGLQASDVGNRQSSPRAPTAGDLHSLPRAPLGSGLQSPPRAPPSSGLYAPPVDNLHSFPRDSPAGELYNLPRNPPIGDLHSLPRAPSLCPQSKPEDGYFPTIVNGGQYRSVNPIIPVIPRICTLSVSFYLHGFSAPKLEPLLEIVFPPDMDTIKAAACNNFGLLGTCSIELYSGRVDNLNGAEPLRAHSIKDIIENSLSDSSGSMVMTIFPTDCVVVQLVTNQVKSPSRSTPTALRKQDDIYIPIEPSLDWDKCLGYIMNYLPNRKDSLAGGLSPRVYLDDADVEIVDVKAFRNGDRIAVRMEAKADDSTDRSRGDARCVFPDQVVKPPSKNSNRSNVSVPAVASSQPPTTTSSHRPIVTSPPSGSFVSEPRPGPPKVAAASPFRPGVNNNSTMFGGGDSTTPSMFHDRPSAPRGRSAVPLDPFEESVKNQLLQVGIELKRSEYTKLKARCSSVEGAVDYYFSNTDAFQVADGNDDYESSLASQSGYAAAPVTTTTRTTGAGQGNARPLPGRLQSGRHSDVAAALWAMNFDEEAIVAALKRASTIQQAVDFLFSDGGHTVSLFSCPICADEELPPEDLYIVGCRESHRVCLSCTARYTKIALLGDSETAVHLPACPMAAGGRDSCGYLMDQTEIITFLALSVERGIISAPEQRQMQRTLKRLYNAKVRRENNFIRCVGCQPRKPTAQLTRRFSTWFGAKRDEEKHRSDSDDEDEGAWFCVDGLERSGAMSVTCPRCDTNFCSSCQSSPYHYGCNCNEYVNYARAWQQFLSTGKETYLREVARNNARYRQMLTDYETQRREHERDLADAQARYMELVRDEEEKAKTCRLCPHCGRIVMKVDGCDYMVCGRNYHGGDNQSGCGKNFSWSKAQAYVPNAGQRKTVQELNVLPPTEAQLVRHHVIEGIALPCDECNQPIEGPRIQCINCPSRNLCLQCSDKDSRGSSHHSRHVCMVIWRDEGAQ